MRFFEAKAYGLHETRNPLFPQKETQTPRRLWLIGVLSLGSLLSVWGALIFGPYLRLQTIHVTGAATLAPEEISATIQDQLQTRRWVIFPNSHRWFYSEAESEQILLSTFPLKGAHIQTRGQVITVDIVEDIFLVGLKAGDSTLILNTQGEVISTEAPLPADAPLIVDKTQTNRATGDNVFSPEVIEGLIDFHKGLQAQGIKPQEFISDEPTLPWFTVMSDQDYVILFDATRDIEDQLLLLKTVIAEYLTTQELPRSIDVRFGSRVYIR
jgi:hypothetical protein